MFVHEINLYINFTEMHRIIQRHFSANAADAKQFTIYKSALGFERFETSIIDAFNVVLWATKVAAETAWKAFNILNIYNLLTPVVSQGLKIRPVNKC